MKSILFVDGIKIPQTVARRLRVDKNARAALIWLTTANDTLGGAKPLELIRSGHARMVVRVLSGTTRATK